MYIEQAYKSLHDGWRYLLGFLIVFFLGWQIIGAIPLILSSFLRADSLMAWSEAGLENFMPLYEGENNLYLALMLFTFIGGLITLIFVIKYFHKQKFSRFVTARNKTDWGRILFAFGIWSVFMIGSVLLAYYFTPEDLQWNFNLWPFLGLLAVTLLMLPLQTSFEEFLFRGYLMQGIGVNVEKSKLTAIIVLIIALSPIIYLLVIQNLEYGFWVEVGITLGICLLLYPVINLLKHKTLGKKWVPLFVTSVLFGMMHALNPEIEKLGYIVLTAYVGLGFFLGIFTLMDDGMELALGFHASNNMIIALLVTSDWTALQTDSVFLDVSEPSAIGQILPIFIVLPILTFIFAKKYKWSGWKEKLFGAVQNSQDLASNNVQA